MGKSFSIYDCDYNKCNLRFSCEKRGDDAWNCPIHPFARLRETVAKKENYLHNFLEAQDKLDYLTNSSIYDRSDLDIIF